MDMVRNRNARILRGLCLCASFCLAGSIHADPPLTGSGPFADGNVIHAVGSGTVASRVLQKTSFESSKDQIKFEIQILSIDSETRDKIYQTLGVENVQTQITTVGDLGQSSDSELAESELSSRRTIATGSIVSTAVLDQEQVDQLYELATESEASTVIGRPRIISADGQSASFQQHVQRPFLSDLKAVKQGEETAVRSEIQVLNEGTDVAVRADIEGESLRVWARIQHSRVVYVEQHHVYGVASGQSTIQVPSHEVRQATAVGKLLPEQSLMLDPYFQSKRLATAAADSPLINKIPYVNGMFAPAEQTEWKMNTLILLKAVKL